MAGFYFNGKVYYFPGAFGMIQVVSSAGAAIPEFQIGLIMGKQDKGKPYTDKDPFIGFSKLSDVWNYYGRNSEIALAYEYAKKMGMGACFCVGMNPSTQPEFKVLDETPTDTIIFIVRDYGALANDHQIEIDGVHNRTLTVGSSTNFILGETVYDTATQLKTGVVIAKPDATHMVIRTTSATPIGAEAIKGISSNATATLAAIGAQIGCVIKTTPPKNSQFLTADVLVGATQISVQNVAGISAGQSFIITDNNGDYEDITVLSVNSVTNVLTLESAITTAAGFTTAKYARIFQNDTDNIEESEILYSQDEVIAYYNENKNRLLIAEKAAENKSVPAQIEATYVTEFVTNTPGTLPPATVSDYQTAFALFPDLFTEFSNVYGKDLRVIYPVTDNETVHGYLKAFATERRALGKPISGIVGGGENDIDRVALDEIKAINHQDIQYAVGGVDDLPSYKSHAALLFGNRIVNAVAHNQTFDKVPVSKVEAWYNEESAIGVALINGGGMVITIPKHAKGMGYIWAKGQNTLLANTVPWNLDNTTYLVMQRDLSDYAQKIMVEGYEGQFVGNDNLTINDVDRFAKATIASMVSKGIIISGKVDEIIEESEGWTIKWAAKLPRERNYIGIVTQILA